MPRSHLYSPQLDGIEAEADMVEAWIAEAGMRDARAAGSTVTAVSGIADASMLKTKVRSAMRMVRECIVNSRSVGGDARVVQY
jgi:hypothetical protein